MSPTHWDMGEIQCQFIILARKDELTPDFVRKDELTPDFVGKNVEGLSHCEDKSCVVEPAVQKRDCEDSTLRCVISAKPLLAKRLRKFNN